MDHGISDRYLRILALKGAAVFLVFTLLAVARYPNYSFWHNYLSDLGKYPPSAPLFNTGIIITGLINMFLFLLLVPRGRGLMRIPTVLACIASIGLIGVGVYPSTMPVEHGISVLIFFGLMGLAILSLSIAYWKEGSKDMALFGALVFASDVVLISLNHTDMGPALQKIAVSLMLIFVLVFAHRLPNGLTLSQHPEA